MGLRKQAVSQALNCLPDAEHPLRGLDGREAARIGCHRARRPGRAADGADGGLGEGLTVPMKVTGNAGLTGSTACGYDVSRR
ncbi:MAG TPA: hypothetical protein VGK19_24380 [Capsulimonadaceae bacterium]|jgi:hypothetical protein